MFFVGLQCNAMLMQSQSDIESIERRNTALQKISGYNDLKDTMLTLSKVNDQQRFLNVIREVVRKVDVIFVFIQQGLQLQIMDSSSYSMFGTMMSNISQTLQYEQTKPGSRFNEFVNAAPNPEKDQIKQALRNRLNIIVP
jgi:hypothetical protein